MENLYREFILDNAPRWLCAKAFIEANFSALAQRGEPLRLIITTAEEKRRAEQNRYYWVAVITQIADQAWADGNQYSKEAWHEYAARKFGILKDVTLPNGEVVTKRLSTTEMGVREFSEYTSKVEEWAASELGVRFYLQQECVL